MPEVTTNIYHSHVHPAVPGALGVPSEQAVRLRMIVADDSLISRTMMHRVLSKLGFDLHLVSDGLEAWELLQAEDVPTIAFLDWMMPGVEGIELCRKVRQLSHQHYTYTMLLTSRNHKSDLIEGLQAGADDYITKPFDADEIKARLLVAGRIIRFQEELLTARDAMKKQASRDYLTQLFNRAGIMEVLEKELNRSRRTGESLSVIMGDIDHFKRINDTHGHLTGDDVLFEVANRIKSCVRSYDAVGRYGGEEFLVVLPGCDEAAAFQVAEKIRENICRTFIPMAGRNEIATMSLGVNAMQSAASADALLAAADSALYRAKHSGRNRTELASRLHPQKINA